MGSELPRPAQKHCIARVNASHYFFTLGDDVGDETWMFDEGREEWMEIAPTMRVRGQRSICGYHERRGFAEGEVIREIVVAGGAAESFAHRATEILDLVRRTSLSFGD